MKFFSSFPLFLLAVCMSACASTTSFGEAPAVDTALPEIRYYVVADT